MNMPFWMLMLMLACVLAIATGAATAGITRTFTIEEPFGLAWGPDRVSYTVEFPRGEVVPRGVSLTNAEGEAVPVQLTDIVFWPDKKTVQSATATFMVTLQPDEEAAWKLTAGKRAVKQPKSDLVVKQGKDTIEFSTAKTGIRLAGGSATFMTPAPGEKTPAPIQGVRLDDGRWIGKGWWKTDVACTGYSAMVEESGPVVARARLRYDFDGGKYYEATVELAAGQDIAIISESFNLSEGKRYAMPELPGARDGDTFSFVMPSFPSEDAEKIWDWWGQTHGNVPAPNAYYFSLYDGLQPDSAEFAGRAQHEWVKAGDGGLAYDKDSRVISLNAWLQWGMEESLYFGLYNSKQPARQLAVIALRPSEWVHPDITPHPNATLKQYTQTNNLWVERTTGPDLYLKAPANLGKRVYGIGALPREQGKDKEGKEIWQSPIMLRHVRLGRCELNRVKDWVLDYEETSEYPRLFVPEGDRARMESRRTRKPIEEMRQSLKTNAVPDANEQKIIDQALNDVRGMVHAFATADYGHMMYGINEGLFAHRVEAALSVPGIPEETAGQIRRYVAAIVYNAINPDFVPPRKAGFAWGSANMMDQVRCRCALLASLLPNHPNGKEWRRELAYLITLYIESQINEAGATLECPHYGTMAITMPAIALTALSNCGDADLSRAEQRLRTAARHRLATLLPYDIRGGFRSTAPIGDGYYESEGAFPILAGFFADRDPELAANLAWGAAESGQSLDGHPTEGWRLFDPGMKAVAPKLGSEVFPGNGIVMRNGFPRKDEAFVMITAGSHSWGHGHCDRGAWMFYAKGVPLMIDYAGMYTPSLRECWLHAGGLTFNHTETVTPCPGRDKDGCWYQGAPWEQHTVEPFTCLQPGQDPSAPTLDEALGKISAFQTLPEADYAEMVRPMKYFQQVPYLLPEPHGRLHTQEWPAKEIWLDQPFTWTRRYIFVKDEDPMGDNYLVVRDWLPGNTELDPALNLWALADKLEVKGQTGIYTGQHGVDLHCYVAEPATFTHKSHAVGHTAGFGFAKHYQKTFGKPFKEEMIQLQIPQRKRDGGYFVAMVPVKQGEAAPRFETLLNGKALRVKFADREDIVVLLDTPETLTIDGITVTGSALVIKKINGKVSVTNLTPGTARW